MKKLLFILFTSALSLFTSAQKAPIKFGNVSLADLQMSRYDKDTSASAVILCDYGFYNSGNYEFTRTLRIKILKKEGYQFADQIFETKFKSKISGYTYNLENGQIVKEKLSNKSIFEERVFEDYTRMRVSMPNVRVGSVIDIEYLDDRLPSVWHFQNVIPILWSELVIEKSPYIKYRKKHFGLTSFFINSDDRWVTKDVPAFANEPYINSPKNYISKFEIEITEINYPGFYKTYSNSWTDVGNLLISSDYFGNAISNSNFLNNLVHEINSVGYTKEEKIDAAYKAIKKIKWNGDNEVFTSTKFLSDVYKNAIGNAADINLILHMLLSRLGIETGLVVLSTRENGIVYPYSVTMEKLNHVIVYAQIDSVPYLIDATEPFYPWNVLPEKCLNGLGQLIFEKKIARYIIEPDKKDKLVSFSNLELSSDMTLKGNAKKYRYDYAAVDFRKHYKTYASEEDYLEELKVLNKDLKIESYAVQNLDNLNEGIIEDCNLSSKSKSNVNSSEIYLSIPYSEELLSNPFKQEKRRLPINFPYATDYTDVINITLADNIEVVKLPETIKLKLPENGASFMFQATQLNNQIVIKYKFTMDKLVFDPAEYQDLKDFYNAIAKKLSETILLKKI
jgi:RNAse (barnase) inhibitor barstar